MCVNFQFWQLSNSKYHFDISWSVWIYVIYPNFFHFVKNFWSQKIILLVNLELFVFKKV